MAMNRGGNGIEIKAQASSADDCSELHDAHDVEVQPGSQAHATGAATAGLSAWQCNTDK
jgi:hypothetical protein